MQHAHISAAHVAAPHLVHDMPIPSRLNDCLNRLASRSPSATSALRTSRLQWLREQALGVRGRSEELLASAPTHVQAVLRAAATGGPNLGLIELLLDNLSWHDLDLLSHLTHGFPFVGDLPIDTEAPLSDRRIARIDPTDLLRVGHSQQAAQIERQSRPLTGEALEDTAALWEQTLEEARLGRLSPLVPASESSDIGPLTRRFAVRQLTSSGARKVRCIDDFAESLVNDACSVRRRIRMGRISDLVTSVRRLRTSHPSAPLDLLKSDFKAAYRGCPIRAHDLPFSKILIRSPSGELFVATQLAMPFGAVSAVYAWDRLGAFLAAVLMDLFDLPVCRYVDDMFLVDFAACSTESRSLMLEVISLLGFTLEESKTPAPSPSMDILGINVSLDTTGDPAAQLISIVPEARKAQLWLAQLSDALSSGFLMSRTARQLAGRLSFAAFSSWGAIARSHLRHLFIYSIFGNGAISDRLRLDLEWWRDRLTDLPPHGIRVFPSTPILLYTDAEGSGSLAGVLVSSTSAIWFSCDTPAALLPLLVPRKTQIFIYEILAVLVALEVFKSQLDGEALLGWIDNIGALCCVNKGSSRAPDAHALVTYMWQRFLVKSQGVGFRWVPSKLNISDAPSRGQAPLIGTRVPCRFRWEPILALLTRG